MHSTLLWYIDRSDEGNESIYQRTVDGVCVECVCCEGKLYTNRIYSSDPRRYLDERFIPGAIYKDGKTKETP